MGWRKWIGVALSVLLSVGLFGVLVQAETTLSPTTAASGFDYYLSVVGSQQGAIKSARKDGLIHLSNFAHEVVTPRDAASGLPTGKRQHKPLTIVKPIDKATPLLFQALATNENLTTVALMVTQKDPVTATSQTVYSITLTNASIVSIAQQIDSTGVPYEEISFTYQRIEWKWHDGGVTAQDEWTTLR